VHPGGVTRVAHPTQPALAASIRLHVEEHVRTAYPGFIVYLEIARRHRKSVKTVKGQLTSIFRKLGVTGRAQLIVRLR
jgi:hypothetical protein